MTTKKIIIIQLVIIILGVVVALVKITYDSKVHIGRRDACMNNIRSMSLAIDMYKQDNEELYPDYVSDKMLFQCPHDRTDKPEDHISYTYIKPTEPTPSPDTIIIEHICKDHKHVGYVSGSVEKVEK